MRTALCKVDDYSTICDSKAAESLVLCVHSSGYCQKGDQYEDRLTVEFDGAGMIVVLSSVGEIDTGTYRADLVGRTTSGSIVRKSKFFIVGVRGRDIV